jgi:hypothetical protein
VAFCVLLRLRLDDGTVSEFDVEQTGNPLSGDPQQQGNGFVAHRSAGSGAYVPPSLGYQPPVIAVKTLKPGQTADDEDDI